MKNGKFCAGVIGMRMGNHHCIGYENNPDCVLEAICDIHEDYLQEKQKEHNVRLVTTDYRDIVNDPDIDIISVASPDYYHMEHCVAALKAGKHVICEKPLTLTLDDAKAIIEETKRSKGKFMIGQVCRYAPGFVQAKRLIDQGLIGDLYFVESEYAHNYNHAKGIDNWRIDARRDPFIGGGCHAVDLLRWIAGEMTEVSAYSNHKCLTDWPVNDCTVAIYKFASGAIGKVFVSIGCNRPYTMRSCFYGTKGTIICDNTSPELSLCSNVLMQSGSSVVKIPVDIASHNISAEIDEFVDCIKNNKPVLTDIYEGTRTIAAAMAATTSAKLGKSVTIEPIFA